MSKNYSLYVKGNNLLNYSQEDLSEIFDKISKYLSSKPDSIHAYQVHPESWKTLIEIAETSNIKYSPKILELSKNQLELLISTSKLLESTHILLTIDVYEMLAMRCSLSKIFPLDSPVYADILSVLKENNLKLNLSGLLKWLVIKSNQIKKLHGNSYYRKMVKNIEYSWVTYKTISKICYIFYYSIYNEKTSEILSNKFKLNFSHNTVYTNDSSNFVKDNCLKLMDLYFIANEIGIKDIPDMQSISLDLTFIYKLINKNLISYLPVLDYIYNDILHSSDRRFTLDDLIELPETCFKKICNVFDSYLKTYSPKDTLILLKDVIYSLSLKDITTIFNDDTVNTELSHSIQLNYILSQLYKNFNHYKPTKKFHPIRELEDYSETCNIDLSPCFYILSNSELVRKLSKLEFEALMHGVDIITYKDLSLSTKEYEIILRNLIHNAPVKGNGTLSIYLLNISPLAWKYLRRLCELEDIK